MSKHHSGIRISSNIGVRFWYVVVLTKRSRKTINNNKAGNLPLYMSPATKRSLIRCNEHCGTDSPEVNEAHNSKMQTFSRSKKGTKKGFSKISNKKYNEENDGWLHHHSKNTTTNYAILMSCRIAFQRKQAMQSRFTINVVWCVVKMCAVARISMMRRRERDVQMREAAVE